MFKKILQWTIYAGIVGLLIFGGVIRTQAKAGQEGSQSEFESDHEAGSAANLGREGNGTGGRTGEGAEYADRSGGGTGRNQGASGGSEELHLAEEEEHEWIGFGGVVSELDYESLWIMSDQGESLEITGRAWLFIQEAELVFEVDDEVELEGFFENDEFEVSAIRNLTSGTFLQIREDSGRPLWSGGRGR